MEHLNDKKPDILVLKTGLFKMYSNRDMLCDT